MGRRADLAILDMRTPSLTPANDLIAALSYSVNGSEVETVIIDGAIVMKDRKILTFDENEVYDKVAQIVDRIGVMD